MPATVRVKRKHLAPILGGHPWVFADAIEAADGDAAPGEVADFVAPGDRFLGRGFFNRRSAIPGRILTRDPDEAVDLPFFRRRVERAIAARRLLGVGAGAGGDPPTNSWRLVHGDADLLPGLVVDRYGPWLVVSLSTAGMELLAQPLLGLLAEVCGARGIVIARGDLSRAAEGLQPGRAETAWGEPPPTPFLVEEGGVTFEADLLRGHKTGFYLDQRENRALVRRLAPGREVLDAYCYTGGFALSAAAGGAAAVTGIDSSRPALAAAARNGARLGVPESAFVLGEAGARLRAFAAEGRQYDMVILDPPKFARGKRMRERALRGYRAILGSALSLGRPGALLLVFSCSAAVGADHLLAVCREAADALHAPLTLLRRLGAAPDHPVSAFCPETEYLSGLLLSRG
ncbi:MAG: class I SAM-dependent rRNA methyltransferase [Planctomycetes bacterium]|nr:class I SAM-dependent rRNA methyltransferase [Planctomycetota bacterium]